MFLGQIKLARLLFITLGILLPTITMGEISPYFGIDQQINKMRFKEGYGHNLFSKHYPQVNFYVGARFVDNFGIELGYVSTASKPKLSILHANDIVLGAKVPHQLSPIKFLSYIKITGYHLGLVNFYAHPDWEKLRIVGGVGVSFLRAEAERYTISANNFNFQYNYRTFKKQKSVIRLILAPEYKFQDHLGLRTSFCFINTSKMKIKAIPIENSYTPIIRPKDSLIFSLGLFFDF